MPPRTTRIRQTDDTRKKIQATQLIKRLTTHALSDTELMTASQVNAAKILLGKTLPDLKALEHSTVDEDGVTTGFKVEFTNDKRDSDTSEV
tara:strand:+ start:522 stop:794 length:273 start_codon:yes stop_codon:yes gene_type:complete